MPRNKKADLQPEVPVDLGEYEGVPIVRCGLELPGAAGGLRKSMKVQPVMMHHGERHFVAFEIAPEKFRHDPVYDGNDDLVGWELVTIANVLGATFTSENAVAADLAETAERIQRAREKAEGVGRLPTPEELTRQHELGEHAEGLVEKCPECDAEVAAGDREADGS